MSGTVRSMHEPVWQFHHSIECRVPRQFAWDYWTNIANWNDPPATFDLDGPFDAGSQLTTRLPGQTFHSVIRHLVAGHEAIIEMSLEEATISFHWKFESASEDRTRILQLVALSGRNAEAFVAQASVLEASTPGGMKKLVATIERSFGN